MFGFDTLFERNKTNPLVHSFSTIFHIGLAALLFVCSGASRVDADAGDLYTTARTGGPILRIVPDGTQRTFAEGVGANSSGMAFDGHGNLFIAAGERIVKISPDGRTRSDFALNVRAAGLIFNGVRNLLAASGANKSIVMQGRNGASGVG